MWQRSNQGNIRGDPVEDALADPRVRAMFVRPTNGFEWRADVEPLQRVLMGRPSMRNTGKSG